MSCEKKALGCGLWACGVLSLLVCGCGYGEVSPAAYAYAKALYGVANRQAADRLDAVDEQIAAAEEAGELSPREAGWLGDIVDEARDGDWKDAAAAARRMMEDQVG